MKRIAPFVLVLATACGGGGGDTPTAPTPAVVVSVTIATTVTSLNIGETATLTATPFDSKGAAITGRAVTWASSNATIASVSTAGLVTAITAGGVVITATVDTKSAQAPITVTTSSPKCDGVTPASLQVGEVRTLTASERSLLCVSGGAGGAEYAIIPVNLSTTIGTNAAVSLISSNTVAAIGAPAAAQLSAAVRANATIGLTAIPTLTEFSAAARMPRNLGFERTLRTREREVRRSVSAASHSASRSAMRSRRPVAAGRSNILGLPATPTLGTLVVLNANANRACDQPINRTGRVAAVSNAAIVVVDTTAPAGGFSDAEYLSIATTFDTLVYSLDTAAFGAPYDMDNNGRVLMFFTTAVNQLSAKNATSVIGGFFFERDIVPRVANAIVPFGCPTSNEGEMFYLPVVDAGSTFNGFFTSKATMLVDINSTTVHEFQHLINASRRYYVTPEIVESEEAWLGEGMSHLAEEILYLHVAGLGPKADLGFQVTTQPASRNAALIAYQVDNLSRYNGYLKATEANSPYADNDELATRGAGWALLRYSLDRSPNPPNTYLRALVNAPTQGIPNFNNVFASIGGLVGAVRTFVVANFTDNAVPGVQAAYQHGSWNFRDWLPHFTANNSRFPLVARSLFSGVAQSLTLVPGGSGYVRFRVNAGAVGGVSTTVTAATTPVDFLLVRTQ